ncbi:TetR/AcrR family transcriptional regulator [Microbacterium timonense]|uniref:TetR/AcrR family transcriptional regulator n=1 Tax=Microbacterium timonense TaxID=2086576 RepID=UPI000D0EB97F|nr:TetR/AcrR family transcriptional regulator [Microbacterium timonense]
MNDTTGGSRADARENRRRLLSAATTAVAERGLDISALDIAQAAGVGVGTLYRRFGTKEALLDDVVLALYDEVLDAADECRAIPDAWEALSSFVFELAKAHRDSRGLAEVTAACDRPVNAEIQRRTQALQEAVRQMTDAAHAAGELRPDVTWQDVILSTRAALETDHCLGVDAGPDGWRRVIGLLLDGMRVPARRLEPPTPAVVDDERTPER